MRLGVQHDQGAREPRIGPWHRRHHQRPDPVRSHEIAQRRRCGPGGQGPRRPRPIRSRECFRVFHRPAAQALYGDPVRCGHLHLAAGARKQDRRPAGTRQLLHRLRHQCEECVPARARPYRQAEPLERCQPLLLLHRQLRVFRCKLRLLQARLARCANGMRRGEGVASSLHGSPGSAGHGPGVGSLRPWDGRNAERQDGRRNTLVMLGRGG